MSQNEASIEKRAEIKESILKLFIELGIIEICSSPSTSEASTTTAEERKYKVCAGFLNLLGFFEKTLEIESFDERRDDAIIDIFCDIYSFFIIAGNEIMNNFSFETQMEFNRIAGNICVSYPRGKLASKLQEKEPLSDLRQALDLYKKIKVFQKNRLSTTAS